MDRTRAVSPVISTILMVAVTVVLAATISVFVLDLGEDVQDPAPNVAQSSGELVGGGGADDQLVRITHLAGDDVAVADMEIVVEAPQCSPNSARLTNFPVEGNDLDSENIVYGENLVDTSPSYLGTTWDFGVLEEDTENTFESGEFFEFRINGGTANCNGASGALLEGDTVTVRVVHTPSNAILIDRDLRVSG